MVWCIPNILTVHLLGKFDPKILNHQFMLKNGIWSLFWFSIENILFRISPQNWKLKLNLVPRVIRICRIQWWCSIVVFDKKYPFWANLVQKLKIVSLRWNMGPRLIHIWRIQWWCSLFLFSTASTFFGQIWSKKFKIVSLGWNLGPSLIWTCRIQWWCLLVLFSTENILFRQIWSKNSKLSV